MSFFFQTDIAYVYTHIHFTMQARCSKKCHCDFKHLRSTVWQVESCIRACVHITIFLSASVFFFSCSQWESICGSMQPPRETALHPKSFFRVLWLFSWKSLNFDGAGFIALELTHHPGDSCNFVQQRLEWWYGDISTLLSQTKPMRIFFFRENAIRTQALGLFTESTIWCMLLQQSCQKRTPAVLYNMTGPMMM